MLETPLGNLTIGGQEPHADWRVVHPERPGAAFRQNRIPAIRREPAIGRRPAGPAVPLMAPAPAPGAVLGDALWCLGLGCLLAAARGALRLALGKKTPLLFAGMPPFAAAAVTICGFAAGTSGRIGPLVHERRSAAGGAVLALGRAARRTPGGVNAGGAAARPLLAAHKMLLQPLQDRAAQARTVRKKPQNYKKIPETQNSAEKQLQKPSIILYN